MWELHKLSPCAREKKGLHSNALAVGVCRLPRLPGDAAQNWEDGNRPVFGELWAKSEHPYTYGRVQRDQALPFFTLVWPPKSICHCDPRFTVQNSSLFWNPKETTPGLSSELCRVPAMINLLPHSLYPFWYFLLRFHFSSFTLGITKILPGISCVSRFGVHSKRIFFLFGVLVPILILSKEINLL